MISDVRLSLCFIILRQQIWIAARSLEGGNKMHKTYLPERHPLKVQKLYYPKSKQAIGEVTVEYISNKFILLVWKTTKKPLRLLRSMANGNLS